MNKSRTPQIFFILAALTLAAGGGATIFQWQEIGDKWDKLAELKKDARDPKDIQAEFDETSSKVVASKAELEHLEKGIPAFAYVPTMLKELEAFGKQNGIDVLGIRPIPKADAKDKSGKRKKAPYEELAIEVKGRGQFKAVQSFISALEKFPKIVSARAVSLQPKNDQAGSAASLKKLDATIELRAFLFAPEPGEEASFKMPGADKGAQPEEPGKQPAKSEPAKLQPGQVPPAGAEIAARANRAGKSARPLRRSSGARRSANR